MMAQLGQKSPKWRQFCDRKRIAFSRPIAQRRKRKRVDGLAGFWRLQKWRDVKITSCCFCLENNESHPRQPLVRSKRLIRWYINSQLSSHARRNNERKKVVSACRWSRVDQEGCDSRMFYNSRKWSLLTFALCPRNMHPLCPSK